MAHKSKLYRTRAAVLTASAQSEKDPAMKATFLEVAQHWVNLARIAEREYGEQTQANERVKDQATSDPAMDWQPPRGKRGER